MTINPAAPQHRMLPSLAAGLLALLLSLACLQADAAMPPSKARALPGPGYQLLFEDNFDGALPDERKWHYRIGERTGLNIDGFNTRASVTLQDGHLVIKNNVEQIDGKTRNTGGGLITNDLFGYGYYEVRVKPFMGGRGLHSAFWQRGEADAGNDYRNLIFEIDSFEIDAPYPHSTNNLYVVPNSLGRKEAPWPHRANMPVELDKDGWMVDAYDYAPDGITFYDNGKVVAHTAYPQDFPELVAQQNVWLTALNGVGKVDRDKQPGYTHFDYFRYYARDYPGHTILPNGTFEYNRTQVPLQLPIAWREAGDTQASMVSATADARAGQYVLRHGGQSAFAVRTFQTLQHILDGKYDLSLWVRTSPQVKTAVVSVDSGPGTTKVAIEPAREWTRLQLRGVAVRGNSATISLETAGLAGQWVEFDEVTFMKPGGKPAVAAPAYRPDVDPLWRLFDRAPQSFSGDDTFYFFDRNLGLGEAMTASLVVQADLLQDAVPMMRAGRTGKEGWAIGLDARGGAYCQVGSAGDHLKIAAPAAYKAGQPVMLTCVYERGTISLYVDGMRRAQQTTSEYGTRDEKAAGRLGATAAWYDAVGDVTAHAVPEDGAKRARNFNGSLSRVAIYNRTLSEAEIAAMAAARAKPTRR